MDKVKSIVSSTWFRAALAGGIGVLLLLKGAPLYAGIDIGVGAREFLLSIKS